MWEENDETTLHRLLLFYLPRRVEWSTQVLQSLPYWGHVVWFVQLIIWSFDLFSRPALIWSAVVSMIICSTGCVWNLLVLLALLEFHYPVSLSGFQEHKTLLQTNINYVCYKYQSMISIATYNIDTDEISHPYHHIYIFLCCLLRVMISMTEIISGKFTIIIIIERQPHELNWPLEGEPECASWANMLLTPQLTNLIFTNSQIWYSPIDKSTNLTNF